MRVTYRAGAPASWRRACAALGAALVIGGCGAETESPPAVSLVRSFSQAQVSGSPAAPPEFPPLVLGLGDDATIAAPEGAGATRGWKALHDVSEPQVRDGRIVARATGKLPILAVPVPEGELPSDVLGAIEIALDISAGKKLGVVMMRERELDEEDVKELIENIEEDELADLVTDLTPGEDRTYRLTEADSPFSRSESLGSIGHLGLVFFGAEGADISLGPVRFFTRSEHLARIPAGFGWHGLGDVYRETVVARSPETVTWSGVELGEGAWLDVAVGSPEPHPATYRIQVTAPGAEPIVVRRTVTRKEAWHPVVVDLAPLAGRAVEISLALTSEDEGRIGFWGGPTVRHRGAVPAVGEPTPARSALSEAGAPRGIVLMVADTLRSDHLDAWGYERPTAPTLARLAAEGTRFADNVSQGTWTKVAVSSILTSLYASTHGLEDIPDRIPASVTTLAEALREAGYTTFHTSSVLFSGRNSNLQQGVEVLHERASLDLGEYRSKSARTYVDRILEWLDTHHEQPFFVFLHVFDPHSPFRPFEPWDRRWVDDDALAAHEANLEKLAEVVDVFHGLPTAAELEEAGVSAEEYLAATRAWYDASIRAMDVEVARLFERLEEHGVADDVLFAFVADHGEEFLEHGRSWHGHSVYGDMINVPMFVRWPGVVPAGVVVERTTQSIDLMPTLLELTRLPVPEAAQGRSLVPVMAAPDDPTAYGGGRAPVFSETAGDDEEDATPDAYAVVHDGWKLIWNAVNHDDRPELELFDHRADPLNLVNLADEHPDKVAELKKLLDGWKAEAEAARVSDEGLEEDLSPQEIEELRALGYLN